MTKEQRAFSVVSWVAGGMVHLPEGVEWVTDFVDQHKRFPKGDHDDLVDTTAMAIVWLKMHVTEVAELLGQSFPAPYGERMAVANLRGREGYWRRT